ncbi:MAG: HAMP domain-containing histidine kinase, partial [Myxococcaceae bacterium]|nr:HAMP domain-containing histidine kinase [Myxococcaceae bacterium]
MKLHEFLEANRTEVLERSREIVVRRQTPGLGASEGEEVGVPLFYDQLIVSMRRAEEAEVEHRPARALVPSPPTLQGEGAGVHGRHLQRRGFSLTQLVHIYGSICDTVTTLATSKGFVFGPSEFNLFNRCLDDAIGQAVAEFEHERDEGVSRRELDRLGGLAHELRNTLAGAMAALSIIRRGVVGVSGKTGGVLDRSLQRMRDLIDRSLTEVRLRSETPPETEQLRLDFLIEGVVVTLTAQAEANEVAVKTSVEAGLEVSGDGHMLISAIANLVQNGLKFTRAGGTLTIRAASQADRVCIEVEDECGGLSPELLRRLREPDSRTSTDPKGLGFGLRIAYRAVAAHDGHIEVRDV